MPDFVIVLLIYAIQIKKKLNKQVINHSKKREKEGQNKYDDKQ